MNLQVRITGADRRQNVFSRLADVVDVSANGARLAGIHLDLAPGTDVRVQCGSAEAPFRIVWVGEKGTARVGEIGITAIDPKTQLWVVNTMDVWKDVYTPSAAEKSERRSIKRYKCDIPVRVTPRDTSIGTYGKCTDISRNGCYVESWTPFDVGTELHLQFEPSTNVKLSAKAVVKSKDPAFGMGVLFAEVDAPEVLAKVVAHFASNALLAHAAEARRERKFRVAERDLEEAIEVCRTHGSRLGLARAYAAVGQVKRDQRQLEEALKSYHEAASIYRNDRSAAVWLAHVLRHIADIHTQAKQFDQAEHFYDEALGIYRSHEGTPVADLANAIRGLAILKGEVGKNEDARALWEEARYLYKSAGVEAGVAETSRRIAQLTGSSGQSR